MYMSRPRSESGPILNWSSPDPNFDLILNIHRYDVGAKQYSHKVDLDDNFADRVQQQNLAFLKCIFILFYRIQTKSLDHRKALI